MPNQPKPKTITNPVKEYGGGMGILYNSVIGFENSLSLDPYHWRWIARRQPLVMVCIGNHIMRIQALPWDIRAKDANRSEELRDKIEEHRKIFKDFGGVGFLNGVDLLLQDYFMIPFGGAIEPVKYSDKRLFKLVNIDGATLQPTNNPSAPVIQKVGSFDPVFYKPDEIARMYQFPRPEIERRGWGMSPVERVYLAIELLARGDRYYAQLLLDTPEAGLLDLGDMSKESAEKWLESFRSMLSGVDAFKIPVLYQHTTKADFIPFGRPPTEMLFDQITFKYAQMVASAFGLTAGDIGIKGPGGAGLSGQIRDERNSRATGYASVKAKLTELFNSVLPEDLEFAFIDTDDELLVAKGRARSANAVAGRNLIESGALTPQEWRKQLVADGLVTIPLTEEPDENEFDILTKIDGTDDQLALQEEQLKIAKQNKPAISGGQGGKGLNKQRNVRGGKLENIQGKEPKPASAGGQGEIKSDIVEKSDFENILEPEFKSIWKKSNKYRTRKIVKNALREIFPTLKNVAPEDYELWKAEYIKAVFSLDTQFSDDVKEIIKAQINAVANSFVNDEWWHIELDETSLGDTLVKPFSNGLLTSAQEIQGNLYEEGLAETPEITLEVKLSDTTLEELYQQAGEIIKLTNAHNKFMITRLSIAAIVEAFASDENTVDLETTLGDEIFIDKASNIFESNLESLLEDSLNKISNKTLQAAYQSGIQRQLKEVGFSTDRIIRSELKNIKPDYFIG